MQNIRIAYITSINPEGTRAHVHNTLKTCESLKKAGAEIKLINICSKPENLESLTSTHHIKTSIDQLFLNRVSHKELFSQNILMRLYANLQMSFWFTKYLWKYRAEYDVLYHRYHLLLLPQLIWSFVVRKPTVYESHYVYLHKPYSQAINYLSTKLSQGVVAITDQLRQHYKLDPVESIVFPCHASEHDMIPQANQIELRRQLSLPVEGTMLCYTGTIGSTIQGISYEVETMVDILKVLPETYFSVIVGAKNNDEYLIKHAEEIGVSHRLFIKSWCDRDKIFKYLKASDILLLPRVGTAPGSSPSKMFDYLAVAKPIVAASTPAVDEVLVHEDNALLVDANQPEQWIDAIKRLILGGSISENIVNGALKSSVLYSWEKRGIGINNYLKRTIIFNDQRKKRSKLRGIAILFFGYFSRLYIKLFGTRSAIILAYHSISNQPWIHAVNPEAFKQQLEWLDQHAEVVTLASICNENLKRTSKKRIRPLVALTFDDGYKDWVHSALPILKNFHMPATFFITTEFKSVATTPQKGLDILEAIDIKQLSTSHQIGSHSHTHRDLSLCTKEEMQFESVESKQILQKLCDQEINIFCYPKGRYKKEYFNILENNGYTHACAGHGAVTAKANKFALPRIAMHGTITGSRFRARFFGGLLGLFN